MAHRRHKILVVDDLPDWRTTLGGLLKDAQYDVQVAGSSAEALTLLKDIAFDLAVIDMRLDETDEDNREGLSLAAKIKERWPKIKSVIITGYGTADALKEAMEPDKRGHRLVFNFLRKEESDQLAKIVQEALGSP